MSNDKVWRDETAIDVFLQSQEIGHLVTVAPDGWPLAQPMNFLWQGGSIFFHTRLNGEKIGNLRQDPKVAFVVTEALALLTSEFSAAPCHDTQLGRSVLIRGLARELKDHGAKALALSKLAAKYEADGLEQRRPEMLTPDFMLEQPSFHACAVVEIEVATMTARQELLQGKPGKYRAAVAAHFQKLGQEQVDERLLKTARLINQSLDRS